MLYIRPNTFISSRFSRWCRLEEAQEEMPVLQASDQGTRKGVLLQRVHQQRKTRSTVKDVEPHRSPGENLVSKQENEREEDE